MIYSYIIYLKIGNKYFKSPYVLIADDNAGDRVLFKAAFEEIKIKTVVKAVNDGLELMNYLSQRENVLPNILFLDLSMPLKSGLECLMEIKRIDYLKNMAVAIYSGTATDRDIEEAFVNGANVFIRKPNDIETLKNLLEEIIMMNWYYQTSGLNRDNFLLNLSSETKKKVIRGRKNGNGSTSTREREGRKKTQFEFPGEIGLD